MAKIIRTDTSPYCIVSPETILICAAAGRAVAAVVNKDSVGDDVENDVWRGWAPEMATDEDESRFDGVVKAEYGYGRGGRILLTTRTVEDNDGEDEKSDEMKEEE